MLGDRKYCHLLKKGERRVWRERNRKFSEMLPMSKNQNQFRRSRKGSQKFLDFIRFPLLRKLVCA